MGSTITPFLIRFNNYKSGARKVSKVYSKKCNVYQEQFHRLFNTEGNNGMEDLKITIKEAEDQLGYKDIYEEVCNDPRSLISTIHEAIQKIRKRGDLNADTIKYFMVKDPKFARFYLLPRIHERLYDVPARLIVSNCGYYTENISCFLDFYLQPMTREIKSYIKDTNDFLKKLRQAYLMI